MKGTSGLTQYPTYCITRTQLKDIVKEVYYLLVNIKVANKYIDMEMFRKYLKQMLDIMCHQVDHPHLKRETDFLEEVQRRVTKIC